MRMSLPQSAGHDDLAMATCLAATSLPEASGLRPEPPRVRFAGPSSGYELSARLEPRGVRARFAGVMAEDSDTETEESVGLSPHTSL
jgi:hypothetical protein